VLLLRKKVWLPNQYSVGFTIRQQRTLKPSGWR